MDIFVRDVVLAVLVIYVVQSAIRAFYRNRSLKCLAEATVVVAHRLRESQRMVKMFEQAQWAITFWMRIESLDIESKRMLVSLDAIFAEAARLTSAHVDQMDMRLERMNTRVLLNHEPVSNMNQLITEPSDPPNQDHLYPDAYIGKHSNVVRVAGALVYEIGLTATTQYRGEANTIPTEKLRAKWMTVLSGDAQSLLKEVR